MKVDVRYFLCKMWFIDYSKLKFLVGQRLHLLGAEIIGYGRKPTLDRENSKHISRYYSKDGLTEFLKSCNYFINVLPSTPESIGLLNGNILENCKGKQYE